MLGKMIRYDLRFGAKKYALIAALTAALLLLAAFGSLISNGVITGLGIFFAALASVAFLVLFIVISVQHLYTHLCGRESYLSFSLPVSVHTLLLSKLICILFWAVVTGVLLLAFWFIGVDFIFLRQSGQSLITMWRTVVDSMPTELTWLYNDMLPRLLPLTVVSILMSITELAFCVSLVNVPAFKERNLGIVMGIAFYFIGGQILGVIQILAYMLAERILFPGSPFMRIDNPGQCALFINVSLIFSIILIFAFYFAAARLTGKKRSI